MYETESGELTDTAKSILQVAPTNVFEPGEGLVADSAAAAEQNNIEQQKNGEGGAGLSSTFENEETAQLRRKAVEAMNMVRAQNLDKAMRMGNVPGALMDDSSDSE
ncbi:hypothetical protein AX774_g1758 [Zancudomyces culisetae]|uniref:Uncharacterized protein n=1 Tax=Zancudomyces culisetae TaxID=1213189 RepID=A0A1R1PUQ7_ZANCU|nr:hypothetical protein AX774_g1758 [Zancudomyces culisetae]|eukprot:OMH84711.1 hypothetical protein AX774_g1758 [Zancudomyces culisetae]